MSGPQPRSSTGSPPQWRVRVWGRKLGRSSAVHGSSLRSSKKVQWTHWCSEHEIQAWGGRAIAVPTRSDPGTGHSWACKWKHRDLQPQGSESLLSAFLDPTFLHSTLEGHLLKSKIPVSPRHRDLFLFGFPKELSSISLTVTRRMSCSVSSAPASELECLRGRC